MSDRFDIEGLTEHFIELQLDSELAGWIIESRNGQSELYRNYRFDSFEQAFRFMEKAVSGPILKQDHHPRWLNSYNRLEVWLTTRDAGNRITNKDLRLAKSFESLWLSLLLKS